MPGLLDFFFNPNSPTGLLGLPDQQNQPGTYDMQSPQQRSLLEMLSGGIGRFGNNIQQSIDTNPLVTLGLGLASGDTPGKGFGNALTAMQAQKKQADQKAIYAAFLQSLGGQLGQPGQQGGPQSPAPGLPAPAVGQAPPVMPSPAGARPGVWGDREAEAAGLYEPRPTGQSAQPAQPAQPAPSANFNQRFGPIAGSPFGANLRNMIAIGAHPDLPENSRKLIDPLITQSLKDSELPAPIKEYNAEMAQLPPDQRISARQWSLDNKRAAATMINTAEGMDAAQTKARISIDTNAIKDLSQKAVAGRSALPLLQRTMELADKTPGGWAGQASPYLAKAMSTIGMEVPENISNAELFQSISRQFIPAVRDPGSTSNYEQQLYSQAVPSLANSPEGRTKIGQMMKSMIDRNNDILAVYRKHVGSPDLDRKLSELDNTPLFTPEQRKALEAATGAAGGKGGAPQGVQPWQTYFPGQR